MSGWAPPAWARPWPSRTAASATSRHRWWRGENGIPFDAPDGEPVRLLVVLLVPEHATEEHLEILSELAELLSDDALRETLLTATDPAQVYRTLATWEPVRPAA